MVTYSVSYKSEKQLFWRTLKNVKGDGILDDKTRWFILSDESRIELPRTYEFKFSKERFLAIKENMSKETGGQINIP